MSCSLELNFMVVANKHPRLTITPTRATLKFVDINDATMVARLAGFAQYVIDKLGDVTQSYRSKIEFNPAGRLFVCMVTDSGKDGHQFVEPVSYED